MEKDITEGENPIFEREIAKLAALEDALETGAALSALLSLLSVFILAVVSSAA